MEPRINLVMYAKSEPTEPVGRLLVSGVLFDEMPIRNTLAENQCALCAFKRGSLQCTQVQCAPGERRNGLYVYFVKSEQ